MNSIEQDQLRLFIEGIITYRDGERHWDRLQNHPEDLFCDFSQANGNLIPCTRDGYVALRGLVEGRLRARRDAKNHDPYEFFEIVRTTIPPHLDEIISDPLKGTTALDNVIQEALDKANKKQTERTYHFPCVLARSENAERFSIGPVLFSTTMAFEELLNRLVETGKQVGPWFEEEKFKKYCSEFGWMVSVRVPRCSPAVSRRRAELAARTAINVVRIWFGQGYGRRMRLVHTEPATANHHRLLVEDDDAIDMEWSTTAEGAAVEDGWFKQVDLSPGANHNLAQWLLRDIVFDEHSEFSDRLIDALAWFGDAAFEPSPGAKLSKLVMLLERLTTTSESRFSKKKFCRRVAILAMEDDSDLVAKYWSAYDLYNARSVVVHGVLSQSDPHYIAAMNAAERTVINALFRAFEVYSLFRFPSKNALAGLRGFYDQQENRCVNAFQALDREATAKDLSHRGRS